MPVLKKHQENPGKDARKKQTAIMANVYVHIFFPHVFVLFCAKIMMKIKYMRQLNAFICTGIKFEVYGGFHGG